MATRSHDRSTSPKSRGKPAVALTPDLSRQKNWLISDWDASIWHVKAVRLTGLKSIRWDRKLSDGSRLTDPPNRQLLETCRQFLAILFDDPLEQFKIDACSTALARGYCLLSVVQWMRTKGRKRFRDISPKDWSDYRALVAFGTDALLGHNSRQVRITADRILEHFRVWQHLRDFYISRSSNGERLLADGLTFDPFPDRNDAVFEARQLGRETGTTKTIPSHTALLAINRAIEWVVYHSEELITLRSSGRQIAARELERINVEKRLSFKSIQRRIAAQILSDPLLASGIERNVFTVSFAKSIGVSFSALYRTSAHRTLIEAYKEAMTCKDAGSRRRLEERCRAILAEPTPDTDRLSQGASWRRAQAELLPYTGSRTTKGGPWPIKTFGSGPTGENSLEGAHICLWTACFVIIGVFMADRLSEILELQDDCLETRKDGDYLFNRTWKEAGVISGEEGYRPCPSIVSLAVNVLLESKKSSDATTNKLFAIPHRGGDDLPDETTVLQRLDVFTSWIGLPADETKDVWTIRPHQLRRFFAVTWVWFYELGPDLLALKSFLRQSDLDTCARYATSVTKGEVLSERSSVSRFVLDRAASDGLELKGGFGNYIQNRIAKLRLTVGSPAKLSREIERLQEKIGLTLTPSPWGYCAWASGRSKYAQCAISAGIEHPLGPVEWARSPSTCSECPNFLYHDGFKDFWEAEAERHFAVLLTPKIDTSLRAAAEEGLRLANEYLSRGKQVGTKIP